MTEKKLSANFHEFFFRRARDVRLTVADYILVILVYDADTGISRKNFFGAPGHQQYRNNWQRFLQSGSTSG